MQMYNICVVNIIQYMQEIIIICSLGGMEDTWLVWVPITVGLSYG